MKKCRTLVAVVLAALMAPAAEVGLKVAVVDSCPTNDLTAVGRGYFNALTAAGHVPFLLPRMESPAAISAALSMCDLVLFPGGEDVEPARYGETPSPRLGRVNKARDQFEYAVLDAAVKVRKPIFGICRGCQVMNTYFGGTLVQDISSEVPKALDHRDPRTRRPLVHEAKAEAGSRLAKVLGGAPFASVSSHHQSVEKLAPGFRVAARAADGVVEAIEGIEYPACGVQFHPERGRKEVRPLTAIFRNLGELTGAKASADVVATGLPVVAIADYCSYLTNVCAKANLVEAQEKAGFASIVVPELKDADVDRLLAGASAVMIGGGIGKRQDYERRCAFEDRVIALGIRRALPIAGICHGSQVINRYLGGTLALTPKGSPITHRNTSVTNINENLHKTINAPGSLMARVMGEGEVVVNSSHSRCSEKPAPHVRVTSRASDGVIEAFEHESLPIKAFQFHPERLWKTDPRALGLLKGALTK